MKRPTAKLLAAATALIAGVAAAPQSADALSCLAPPPPEQVVDEVDLLFEGTAVSKPEIYATRFEIETTHLGTARDTVTILTTGHPWAYEYELGKRTIVAARLHEGRYYAGPCPMIEGGPMALRDWLVSRGSGSDSQ